MRYGLLLLPEDRWAVAAERWKSAEDLGFDHAWTYDHLSWRQFRDRPWFGAIPTLTAAAAMTSRIRLGTLVASPNFRHPVPFAKELMTLDDISEGRLCLGIGAGGQNFDANVLGHEPWSNLERADRFEEFLRMLDTLLTESSTDYEGRFYQANGARQIPGCVQVPRLPFAVAANGPRGMKLAVELGQTWVMVDGRGDAPELIRRLDEACDHCGRAPEDLDRLALVGFRDSPLASFQAFQDTAGRYAELGFTDLVLHWPRTEGVFKGDLTVLDRIASEVLGQ